MNKENPNRIIYPTKEDADEYVRKVENLSNGQNVHQLATYASILCQAVKKASIVGWNDDTLRLYRRTKMMIDTYLATGRLPIDPDQPH